MFQCLKTVAFVENQFLVENGRLKPVTALGAASPCGRGPLVEYNSIVRIINLDIDDHTSGLIYGSREVHFLRRFSQQKTVAPTV